MTSFKLSPIFLMPLMFSHNFLFARWRHSKCRRKSRETSRYSGCWYSSFHRCPRCSPIRDFWKIANPTRATSSKEILWLESWWGSAETSAYLPHYVGSNGYTATRKFCEIQSNLSITRSFSPKYIQRTLHCSDYGNISVGVWTKKLNSIIHHQASYGKPIKSILAKTVPCYNDKERCMCLNHAFISTNRIYCRSKNIISAQVCSGENQQKWQYDARDTRWHGCVGYVCSARDSHCSNPTDDFGSSKGSHARAAVNQHYLSRTGHHWAVD